AERGLDDRLYALGMCLRLPAGERAAVVFQTESNAGHEEKGAEPVREVENNERIGTRSCVPSALFDLLPAEVYRIDSSKRFASCFCVGLPSCITSSRMLRAPSGSPISI